MFLKIQYLKTKVLLPSTVGFLMKLKTMRKDIEIWGFYDSISHKLIKEARKENVHFIDNILDDIKY